MHNKSNYFSAYEASTHREKIWYNKYSIVNTADVPTIDKDKRQKEDKREPSERYKSYICRLNPKNQRC